MSVYACHMCPYVYQWCVCMYVCVCDGGECCVACHTNLIQSLFCAKISLHVFLSKSDNELLLFLMRSAIVPFSEHVMSGRGCRHTASRQGMLVVCCKCCVVSIFC